MHLHCVKSVQIRSFFWSVFSPNAGKYGTEKNSVFGRFSHSVNVFQTTVFLQCLLLLLVESFTK